MVLAYINFGKNIVNMDTHNVVEKYPNEVEQIGFSAPENENIGDLKHSALIKFYFSSIETFSAHKIYAKVNSYLNADKWKCIFYLKDGVVKKLSIVNTLKADILNIDISLLNDTVYEFINLTDEREQIGVFIYSLLVR